MLKKIKNIFIFSAGLVLLASAFAKLFSASGSAHILQNIDPIVGIQFRYVFWIVAVIELIVAGICFFGKKTGVQAGLVAWIATGFMIYRIGLLLVGYHKPCSCLGNLTDALHISPQLADNIMKGVLAYLFIGSYGILFWQWRQGRAQKVDPPTPAPARQEVDG